MPETTINVYVDFPANDGQDAPTNLADVNRNELQSWLEQLAKAIATADVVEFSLSSHDPDLQDKIETTISTAREPAPAFAAVPLFNPCHDKVLITMLIGGCHPKADPDVLAALGSFVNPPPE